MSCCDIPPRCRPGRGRYIFPFAGFTDFTPTIPKMYWDVHSQEQRIHRICDMLDKLICYADYLGDNVEINKEDIEALKSEFEEFKASGFEDYYEEQLNAWIIEHMPDIIQTYVKQVFFGLTLEGNFVAYIPEGSAWDDVFFDTGQVYELDTYGRLMLFYETDANSNVWQDVSIVNDLAGLLNSFDERITANENELNDPLDESEVDDD